MNARHANDHKDHKRPTGANAFSNCPSQLLLMIKILVVEWQHTETVSVSVKCKVTLV